MATAAVEARMRELYAAAGGKLTPAAVVEDARDPASPLHDCFEWDDSKAAEEHRKSQARKLIRTIPYQVTNEVVTVASGLIPKVVSLYQRDPFANSDEPGYTSVPDIRADVQRSAALMRNVMQRVVMDLTKAAALADVLGWSHDLALLLEASKALQDKVDRQLAA